MSKVLDEVKQGTEIYINNLYVQEDTTESFQEKVFIAKIRQAMQEKLGERLPT